MSWNTTSWLWWWLFHHKYRKLVYWDDKGEEGEGVVQNKQYRVKYIVSFILIAMKIFWTQSYAKVCKWHLTLNMTSLNDLQFNQLEPLMEKWYWIFFAVWLSFEVSDCSSLNLYFVFVSRCEKWKFQEPWQSAHYVSTMEML